MRLDGVGAEAAAALADGRVEFGERGEVPVGDRFIDEGPQPLPGPWDIGNWLRAGTLSNGPLSPKLGTWPPSVHKVGPEERGQVPVVWAAPGWGFQRPTDRGLA